MSPAQSHSHRAGKLRQQNKKNKRTSASKRSRTKKAGGKIASGGSSSLSHRSGPKSAASSGSSVGSRARADRANTARLRREASRKAAIDARRGCGTGGGDRVPRVVGILSLSEREDDLEDVARSLILSGADRFVAGGGGTITAAFEGGGSLQRGALTLLTNSSAFRQQYAVGGGDMHDASMNAALDLCRVCDAVLFLIDGSDVDPSTPSDDGFDRLVSERGDRALAACKAQGLPTPIMVVVHRGDEDEGGTDAAVLDDEDDDDCAMSVGAASSSAFSTSSVSTKGARRAHIRRRADLKRYASRLADAEFGAGKCKVFEVESEEKKEGAAAAPQSTLTAALIRSLRTSAASGPQWVADAPRAFLVTDGAATSESGISAVKYDPDSRELKLTGYVRGAAPWCVDNLVHVPHLGTFSAKRIELAGVASGADSALLPPIVAQGRKNKNKKPSAGVAMEDATTNKAKTGVLAESDPERREPLDMFASPDALDGEQNLIGFDDEDDANFDDDGLKNDKAEEQQKFLPGTARPAGWSDYQSAWLDGVDETDEAEEDRGELAFALNRKKDGDDAAKDDDDADMDDDDDGEVNAAERRALLEARKQKAREEDLQFPDEVQVDDEGGVTARDRLARYRSLKNFRKSHWDPKENLPDSYAAVFHFANFKATQKDVMQDMVEITELVAQKKGIGATTGSQKKDDASMLDDDDYDSEDEALVQSCVTPGTYVTITLEGVPESAYSRLSTSSLVSAVSILPHENKVSVLHMSLSQSSRCDRAGSGNNGLPVKSKDVITFRCGWRTWQSRPVFSQNNLNSDRHKFERFMPTDGAFFAATLFGPVTYAPCPVLMFRDSDEKAGMAGRGRQLLAHGSVIGADADRIVLKRIVLTGFPTRVHKRHATIKYMFYNPEDVKWFQPAGITTKHGLQGNIMESIGDHGVMKCLFNAPIKQHDTVCLPLYKRIFPKFAPAANGEMGDSSESIVVL